MSARFVSLLFAILLISCAVLAQAAAANPDATAGPASITVPAGTKVPLVLKNAINTKNARPGDNVYLETNFPVTQNNRIVIPAGTYVQGVINRVQQPGRVKGKAEILMHFTTMIFPNGYTVSLPGALENVPGADTAHMKDKEGTVQADSRKGKDAGTIATTAGSGAAIGAIASGAKGAGIGAGLGGALGTALVLLTRGNPVRLEQGTAVEMVLQRPLTLEESRLSNRPADMVPVNRTGTLEPPHMMPSPQSR